MDEETRADIIDTIDFEVRAGFGDAESLREELEESLRDELPDITDDDVKEMVAHLDRELRARDELEATWTETTTNDRITAAFDALDAKGIVALEEAGETLTDGWDEALDIADERDDDHYWGAAYYHRQDVERGVAGQGLLIAYGAFAETEPEALRVARLVVETLRSHGVPVSWDGTVEKRIQIEPFEWRRRRSTSAPSEH